MNSDAMAFLASKGLTLDEIIEFARLSERKTDRTNADRQARYREKRKAGKSVGVTRNSNAVTPPDKERSPTPPKEINPPISPITSDEVIPPPSDQVTVSEVVEGWNDLAANHGLAQVAKLTDQRRRKVQAQAKRFSVDDWVAVFAKVSQSPFLKGENDRGWRCDFDFILSEQNFIKILEGKYDRQPTDSRR